MNGEGRLALALPVGSPRHVLAATRVVIFLLRYLGRTQLDLVRGDQGLAGGGPQARRSDVLLVSAVIPRLHGDDAARVRLERLLRARIEHEYGQVGLRPIAYDLQFL